ncbi:Glyoxylate hydroxypyruvate reductase A [Micractinium conductrix]|uniref:Glyoxylate hydroxypyruvate reductase A n=1 Tax=Micractinium conductrix TaxID=554055 RepID=A0A2P6VCC7_9CHLO|nr:Glyoxylate hydroxypyruvate reductase A [Micractinium conductrix]|eukprot:PSC71738.1 Glyoxylate hydroxypyruvate reductase A [Micractinium conductrix]
MTTSASAAGVAAGRPAVAAAASTPEQQQAVPQANPALAHSEVLLATTFDSRDSWAAYLRSAGLRLRVHPEDTQAPAGADLSRVEFAICWNPPAVLLQRCPNLKAIQSMGAGVDSMIGEPSLPRHVPLLRVIDPLMSERMATWVLWGVINCQRKCDAYMVAQRAARWDKGVENFRNVDNRELRVGVMGLGVMGGATADTLLKLGYPVSAWTRTPRPAGEHPGIACYSGEEQLQQFVQQTDVLVCLLPLTDATRGIVSARLLRWLPRGAAVINAARGGHLVEEDLLAALDSGHLSAAVLDVFSPEPLPRESRLWAHPRVRVFPHVSSMTNIESAAAQMLANREAVLTGRSPPKELVVDWEAGY